MKYITILLFIFSALVVHAERNLNLRYERQTRSSEPKYESDKTEDISVMCAKAKNPFEEEFLENQEEAR